MAATYVCECVCACVKLAVGMNGTGAVSAWFTAVHSSTVLCFLCREVLFLTPVCHNGGDSENC